MTSLSRCLPPPASGLVLVDKPAGMTSHDVVSRVRRLAHTRKVGHAGTLDPLATGLLVVGVEHATRLLTYLVGADKTYHATIRLGQATTTEDADGHIIATTAAAHLTRARIEAVLGQFVGEIQQIPSKVSAIKVAGERAYARVRRGEEVELAARQVRIDRLEMRQMRPVGDLIDCEVVVDCSSGTYIRALARDIGATLAVGAHLVALRRTRVGGFTIAGAARLEQLAEHFTLTPLAQVARSLFAERQVSAAERAELGFGRSLPGACGGSRERPVAAIHCDTLVALLVDEGDRSRPVAVFA